MKIYCLSLSSYPDIDECAEGNGGCSQLCENKPGSFACKCNTGYSLMEDLSECAGTSPQLAILIWEKIHVDMLPGSAPSQFIQLIHARSIDTLMEISKY